MPTFDAGASGLVGTVGCTILRSDGTVYAARATAGITEPVAGSGCYFLADPDPTTTLVFVWDVGAGTVGASETLYAGRASVMAIKAKTDTIGSLSVTITSPVATDGTVTIEQGDSYDVSGAAIVATIAKADLAYSLTGATVKLKTQQATITGAVSDDATNWYLTFAPTSTQTAALTVVTSAYEIEAMLADSKIKTVQRGTLRVNRDIPAVS